MPPSECAAAAPEFGDGDGGGEKSVSMGTFVLALVRTADREGPLMREAKRRLIKRTIEDLTSEGD